MEPEFRAVGLEPMPYKVIISAGIRNVDCPAMPIAAGCAAAAVERIADPRLEPRREALAIVVAKRAQHGPSDAGCVHCLSGMIELLTEIRVHATNRIFRQRHAHAGSGGRILP